MIGLGSIIAFWKAAPAVLSIDPPVGTVAGGTTVLIEVDDSTDATGATVNGVALTSFAIADATHVRGVTSASSAGPVDVTVTTAFGTTTLVGAFTYVTFTGQLGTARSYLGNIEVGFV